MVCVLEHKTLIWLITQVEHIISDWIQKLKDVSGNRYGKEKFHIISTLQQIEEMKMMVFRTILVQTERIYMFN